MPLLESSLLWQLWQLVCSILFHHSLSFNLGQVDESTTIGTGKFAVVHLCHRKNQPEKKFALKVRDQIHLCKCKRMTT